MIQSFAAAFAAMMLQPSATDPAVLFGARPAIEQASLSPDGNTLAYLSPTAGQGSILYVVPIDGSAKPIPVVVAGGDPERIGQCRWAASRRLVCHVFGATVLDNAELVYFSRLIAIDADGKNIKVLFEEGNNRLAYGLFGGQVIDWLPEEDGKVLMMRQIIPEMSTGTHLAETREGMSVQKVDTRNGRSTNVESPRNEVSEFITDGRGTVRIMGTRPIDNGGYSRGITNYFYRTRESRDWKPLGTFSDDGDGFNPYGVDPDENVVYGLKKLDGRVAAYKIALDGSLKESLVYAHPQVDIDGFAQIGRRGRIVGVTYTTDRAERYYFDPELAKLGRTLAKTIPNLPLVAFADSSVDESKLLIWAGSDTHPGRYYLFDRTSKQLGELLDVRPELGQLPLAKVKSITYKAADGTMIPGYLTLPPGKEDAKGLPAIVMPHGGPGSRDEWGFDWLSQYFANRGYAVLQPNFRGSAGYGDAWFVENGFQSWKTAIGDVDDGGRWLVAQGIADPKKLAIVGWSYGGYAALQSAVTEPGLFGAVVAIAPVTDLEMLKEQWRGWTNFTTMTRFIGSGSHIGEGSPARHASKIKVPVLLFHGTLDRNVRIRQSRVMAARLKDAGVKSELIVYDKRDHYLEDGATRAEMLGKTDAFLRASLGL